MIDAKEARRKATLNGKLKEEMIKIMKSIERAIEMAQFSTTVSTTGYTEEMSTYIIDELTSLGYKATYDPPKPLPPGCLKSQWDFYGYLKVEWGE